MSQVLAIALIGSLAVITYQDQMTARLEPASIDVTSPEIQEEIFKMGDGSAPEILSEERKQLFSTAKKQSFIHIFRQSSLIACILTAVGTLLTFLTVRRRS